MPRTVLFAWECGAGIGHLVQMRPIAAELRRRGHRVFLAATDAGVPNSIRDIHLCGVCELSIAARAAELIAAMLRKPETLTAVSCTTCSSPAAVA